MEDNKQAKKRRMVFMPALSFAMILVIVLSSCETPSKPDFQTEQRYTVPIVKSLSYAFLGGTEAIIDTTSADFENLFTIDPSGLVTLGVTNEFDIGSFDESIPDVSIATFSIDAEISNLEPTISGSAATDFESFTGLDPALFPIGATLPAGAVPAFDLELDMEDLVQVVTREGNLQVTIENQLGFTFDELVFRFRTETGFVGDTQVIEDFAHGEERTLKISFTSGEVISIPLFAVFSTSWSQQQMAAPPEELIVSEVQNDEFRVQSASARFPSQTITKEIETGISEEDFILENNDDFAEMESIQLSFESLRNTIDLDFESLVISFPTILTRGADGSFSPQDSVVINLEQDQLPRRASDPSNIEGISFDIFLEDVRISAPGNTFIANLEAKTENTLDSPPGDRIRTITTEDNFTGTAEFEVGNITRITGIVLPRFVDLNDAPDDQLDLADPEVRIETNIDDLKEFSERVVNLNIDNPELVLHYDTNIDASNLVYAAILGINAAGEQHFLSGLPDTPFHVAADDTISGLLFNGLPIANADLIKIPIDGRDGEDISQQVFFTTENSTVADFLNSLPTEIFFIGKALINPESERVNVQRPITLDSELSLNIPISLQSDPNNPTAIADTLDLDLSDLPRDGDDLEIKRGSLFIQYSNELPLDLDFEFSFLDAFGDLVTVVPADGQNPVSILPAPVSGGGFSVGPENNVLDVNLTEAQLRELWRTEQMQLRAVLLTSDNETVSLRATDQVSLNMRADFVLNLKVGGN